MMIECQGCGRELRPLTSVESRDIIENPYNYIFWCPKCAGLLRELYDD